MPVFNEQASVRKVVTEWFQEVRNWTDSFTFLIINDGSTDDTRNICEELRQRWPDHLEIRNQENRGHGQSCLEGYRVASDRSIPWVFQIDSDGQCDPQYFFRLWEKRQHYDVVYGSRSQRDDGWKRKTASIILKVVLLFFARVYCVDANSPYRLMRTRGLKEVLEQIPDDFFLSNVALAVLLKKNRWKHGCVSIRFRERFGGEPSVPLGTFGAKGLELIRQLGKL